VIVLGATHLADMLVRCQRIPSRDPVTGAERPL